jgi:tRNA nucleotidyltransferase (CCA-adding enzyme)
MSDYMFMLENHLNSNQNRVLALVEAAAAEAGVSLFLTGGAIRDMLGGYPIRDLDFTVEGNAVKLAKALAQKAGATITHLDENKKCVELLFPGGVTVEMAMARQERYAKPGAKAQVTPATIHEDLRGRDFTVNALALSLNRASRGLLLDPTNGLSELERKELRTTGNYTLYDNPVRIFRLIRFKVRLGYQIAERTQMQYENAKNAEVEKSISPHSLLAELRKMASDPNLADLFTAFEQEKLLPLISPLLTGDRVNHAGFSKLQKAVQLLPFGIDMHIDYPAIFFYVLTEKFSAKEKAAFTAELGMDKDLADAWQKLEAKSKKLEKDLQSAKLQKPSALYALLSKSPGEQILFLLVKSTQRLVHDRIKNYLQKYLPLAQEVSDKEVEATGVTPHTPKFQKMKDQMIATKLDARPKKVVEPVPEAAPAAPPVTAGSGKR